MATNRVYRIAVIPGDGIGKEVMPEGVRVLEAAARRYGFEVRQDWFDFSSYEYYERHGRMLPEDWKERIGSHDAIFFGAVGWPEKIPDHISLWGSLLQFRREFDQYVNLRPVRLMPGVPSPLANRKPGDIDFWVVRENTEGEYSSIGGRSFEGTDEDVVMQTSIFTRRGVDRIMRYQRVDDLQLPPYGSGWTLRTSIAAVVSVTTTRMKAAAPSVVVRSTSCAERAGSKPFGVPAPTRSRMIRPRL